MKTLLPYNVKDTGTHNFFLSNRNQEVIPNRAEKIGLQETVRTKKIVFGSKDRAKEVKRKLESTYPLVDGGRFEILRSASKNELVLISPPTVGCSVSFLRDQSVLARATAYR